MVIITPEQVDLWKSLPRETQILEFKEAKRQFDSETLYKYCVAIANEGGGHIVFGVSDELPRRIVGTAAFANTDATANQIFNLLGFRVDVCEVAHPQGRVVVMQIPGRPTGTAYHLRGQYWMRCGSSLVPMTEDNLRSIFKEGEPEWLEQYSVKGVKAKEVLDILDIPGYFRLRKMPLPTTNAGIIERLIQERLIDKVDGGYAVRRLSAILLANRLNDFPELERKAPRVVLYTGSSKNETVTDSTGNRGFAVGFQALVAYIVKRLPQNEVVKEALRTQRLIPEVAIRELAANALIHQDFAIRGTSSMFEIYDNRIEFSSPGLPLFPVERFIDGNQSRNERLASVTRNLRICEEKGSGIDTVIHLAEVYQLPAPEFRSGQGTTIATILHRALSKTWTARTAFGRAISTVR